MTPDARPDVLSASGFELEADKLPSIDELLYTRREAAARGVEKSPEDSLP